MKRKGGKSEKQMRVIMITYMKDPLILHKEIRVKSNYYVNNGMTKLQAEKRASTEVSKIQNTQVIKIENSFELDPISDLVQHIAKNRNHKFTSQLIR